jgi:hypothetical protein
MLTPRQIAVGLVTQAKALRREETRKEDAKRLLNMAGRIMGAQLTGVKQI